jgi:hypothetical protein
MRRNIATMAVALATTALAGCTGQGPSGATSDRAADTSLVVHNSPPENVTAGSPEANEEFWFPGVGSEMDYRMTVNGDISNITLRVVEEGVFEGHPVYFLSIDREEPGFDTTAGNPCGRATIDVWSAVQNTWLACLKDDQVLASALPGTHWGHHPLFVGKRWTATYEWRDRTGGGPRGQSTITREVKAYEAVTVPAGTFDAFRIEIVNYRWNGINVAVPDWGETWWHSLESDTSIKILFWRTAQNPYGSAKITMELVEDRPTE